MTATWIVLAFIGGYFAGFFTLPLLLHVARASWERGEWDDP